MSSLYRSKFKKNYFLLAFVIIMFLCFILLNIGSGLFFGSRKADLTSDGKYTLSEATRQIVSAIKSPQYIRIYLSSAISGDYPELYRYSQSVLRRFESYQALNPERIRLEIKDPVPYSQTAAEAKKLGLRSFLSPDGQTELYFGAFFSNDNGDSTLIPQFIAGRSGYLENDISRSIFRVNNPLHSKIGLISDNIPVNDWAFMQPLYENYDVEKISSQTIEIPLDIETLVVILPGKPHPLLSYALDQYLLRGGRILMFIDPYSEIEDTLTGEASEPTDAFNKLFQNWGVKFSEDQVIGDISLSENILSTSDDEQRILSYPVWMNLQTDQIDQKNSITHGLQYLHLKTPGKLEIVPGVNTARTSSLLKTSEQGGSVDAETVRFGDENAVIENYSDNNISHVLGMISEGRFDSAYTGNILGGTGFDENMLPFLPVSTEDGKVIIIADTDMLTNENWLNPSAQGEDEYNQLPYAQNGELVLRAVDYLSGNTETLGITGKITRQSHENIARYIYLRSAEPYSADYELSRKLLSQRERFADTQKASAQNNSAVMDMKRIKDLEENRNEIKKLQENIKFMEYQTRKSAARHSNLIIWLNTLIFPAIILFVIWMINIALAARRRRKVREIVNEYKIS